MPEASRKLVVGLLFLLGAGLIIGWLYERAVLGLAVAAVLALGWHVRKLVQFDKALHDGDFDAFRFGEGFWQQVFSRLNFEHDRGGRYKKQYRQLLKEIRKSTNAMPDGAVILDEVNDIVTCNRAAKNRPTRQE